MPYAIDPELLPIVALIPTRDLSDVEAARDWMATLIEPMNESVDTTGIVIEDHVTTLADASVSMRVYTPTVAPPASGRPALLDIHGGGFCVGSMDMEHGFATQVARELNAVVVAVEYRLAPEHPFPAALDDCYAALRWMHDKAVALGIDTGRIGVGGQSAGGGLTAATVLFARDRGGPAVCFQFLGIPELDHRLETSSMKSFVDTPMWNRPNAEWSWRYYLGPNTATVSPYASPAIATDLRGLPPAYVTTMEFDPLRDEGIMYAIRMMEAGVSVELHTFPGTFHGSAFVSSAAVSRRAHQELLTALHRGLKVDDF